jgi:23S rRNA (cytosine1962-C5)-methyltransferase
MPSQGHDLPAVEPRPAGGGQAPAAVSVHLLPGRDKAVREGHPWIFSGAVARVEGPAEAPLARVFDAAGRPLGIGLWSPRSQIRVRMLGLERGGGEEAPDLRRYFAARLAEAVSLRQAVLPPETTGFRLLNAEGDGVPGWTIDRFGGVLVSQITAAALQALSGEAYAALAALPSVAPDCAILQLNALPARRAEGLPSSGQEWVSRSGAPAVPQVSPGAPSSPEDPAPAAAVSPHEAAFTESGLAFTADLAAGQKTGFYCDQRENRRLAERLAGGRAVLDLFAHSGAFGVYALRGGARQVTHVESSPRLIERGLAHHAANHLTSPPAARVDWVKADVWDFLRQSGGPYDMVICDPPPLVRKRRDLEGAARAYKDLNRLALGRLAPGGLLLTFSCSGAVDGKLFRQILFAAAVEAGVRVGLLAPLAAAPDHPVAITHPQGEYLKGWLAVVRGPTPG